MTDAATLGSAFRDVAGRDPAIPALLDERGSHSYANVLDQADLLTVRLLAAGCEIGTTVALVATNGAPFVVGFFAVATAGGVVAPLSPALTESELAAAMSQLHVSLVLTTADFHQLCVRAVASGRGLGAGSVLVVEPLLVSGRPSPRRAPGAALTDGGRPDDLALALPSSGTTGAPAYVRRTHRQLLREADRLIRAFGLSRADRVLGVAPFVHVNGLMRSLVASLLSGAALVPLTPFERTSVARAVDEHAVTVFVGVPFMFTVLAETAWLRPVSFSSLRLCVSASAPLRPDVAGRFQKRYGIPVRQLYGTTETGSVAANLEPDITDALGCVGVPLEGVEVIILGSDGAPVPVGTTGEIGIRSPWAADDYRNSSRSGFRHGYFFPGDLGRIDDAGRLYLVGRTSLFISRGAHKVNPYEVEAVIEQHPKVREAVVFGVPAEHGEERVTAMVVPIEACDPGEIVRFCRQRLAAFKVPSIVRFCAELPKTTSGKVRRKALAERYA